MEKPAPVKERASEAIRQTSGQSTPQRDQSAKRGTKHRDRGAGIRNGGGGSNLTELEAIHQASLKLAAIRKRYLFSCRVRSKRSNRELASGAGLVWNPRRQCYGVSSRCSCEHIA